MGDVGNDRSGTELAPVDFDGIGERLLKVRAEA
jgi:hypothetical protein